MVIKSKQADKSQQPQAMASETISQNSRFSQVYIQANYEADKIIQKVIKLVEDKKPRLFHDYLHNGGKILTHSA